jgi:hypothetical protein
LQQAANPVNEFLTTAIFWIAIALVGSAIAFSFFRSQGLSQEEALRRAVRIGYEIWQVSDFAAPRALLQRQVAGKILREAGLVLKAEIVGDATYGYRMAEVAAKPHPELIRVNPTELALGVQNAILGKESDANGS